MKQFDPGADRLGQNQDEFYAVLMAAHEGLSFDQSNRLNARLVLILANVVGEIDTLKGAIMAARKDVK